MIKTQLTAIAAALVLAAGALLPTAGRAETPNADPLSESSVLRDPDVPVLGNPDGDITVVEYFDYQCPYCKKMSPELAKIVREDGKIHLVLKDWPIFGQVSLYAAKLALASKYQGKFTQAHDALIAMKEKLTEDNVQGALAAAGINVARAKHDLEANLASIEAVVARNNEQATALGFRGTPAFIVGHFRVPGALDEATFKRAIAEARQASSKATKK